MFRRLVFEDSAALFTIAAFVTAFTIFVVFTWRALRMKRRQVEHLANLPFETATPCVDGQQPEDSKKSRVPGERQPNPNRPTQS
jgi:hypothetical protein